ncbi:MAG: hypothetical protein IKA88_06370 [Clostridia bacterium]|nr:hypothetical protein [Clostridia bacterium]
MKYLNKKIVKIALLCMGVCVFTASGFTALADATGGENIAENTAQTYKKSDVFTLENAIEDVQDAFAFETNQQINAELNTNTAVGRSTNGVAFFSSTSGAAFSYKNAIDFSNLTKNDSLIEIFPLYANEWATINSLDITLTDTQNEENSFTVAYYTHQNGACYAWVEYAGKELALGTEGNDNYGKLMKTHGAYCSGNLLTLSSKKEYPTPFSISLDYAEKTIYLLRGTKIDAILDLDDVSNVGKSALWKGFSNDTAILKVSMGFEQAKLGGCVVKSVLGHNLDGGFENDAGELDETLFDAPNIKFQLKDKYIEKMPVGAVGVAYPLPQITASDWFFGECGKDNVTVNIFQKVDGAYTKDVTSCVTQNTFLPTEKGEYVINYTAKNAVKTTSEHLYFEVLDKLSPIVVLMDEYATPQILSNLTIPNVEAYGGSGELVVDEYLYYNGGEKALNEDRTLYLDRPGTVTLKTVITGYCGEAVVRYFPLVIPDTVVLSVQKMCKVVQSNTEIVFPEAICYDTATGEKKSVEIRVDGQLLGSDRKYTATKTDGTIIVEYTAENAQSKRFEVAVVDKATMRPSDLMLLKNGDMQMEDSNVGLRYGSSVSGTECVWGYPVVTGNASDMAVITLSNYTNEAQDNQSKFDYIDVTFTNFEEESETAFIRIYRECDVDSRMSYLQINGNGEKYLIDGNLGVKDSSVSFYVDTKKGEVCNSTNYAPICAFEGYTAMLSIVGVRYGNIHGESMILIREISNQKLRSNNNWNDNVAPVVAFSKTLEKSFEKEIGSVVYLPEAEAYDMLSGAAQVSVKVTNPDGENVAIENHSFVVEKTGTYRITYSAQDQNAKKGNFHFDCNVYDDQAPVLTIEESVLPRLSLGDTIIIPRATASDVLDGECYVNVYMRYKGDYDVQAVQMGEQYTFERKGVYELTYFTRDNHYNYVKYVMSITIGD